MKRKINRPLLRGVSMLLASVVLCLGIANAVPVAVHAEPTREELEEQLKEYEQKLEEDKAALEASKGDTADAKKHKQALESQIKNLKNQIGVLAETITTVQNDVGNTTVEIEKKQEEITQKEADIDTRRENFKERMAAMQELHDAGAMAMLASVKNLYQLLTFSEVLQDIANKDTEILEELRTEKEELETQKAELEAKKAELEQLKKELESQKATMNKKQTQLGDALTEAGKDLAEAQEAQNEAQAVLDSDQLNYEALQSQIESLINNATNDHGDLSFNGSFSCPLRSGTYRISSPYGYRTLNGKHKLHAGVDFAAPSGTPIYAAADGYVTYAGWNSGGYGYYVLIYHGQMADGNTYSTLYAHMCEPPSVSAGSYVARGAQIGKVGTTGNSTGNHLHLELWQGSHMGNSVANKATRINPASLIPLK